MSDTDCLLDEIEPTPPTPPVVPNDPFDPPDDFDPLAIPADRLDTAALVEHLHNLTAALASKNARRRRIETIVRAHIERIDRWQLAREKAEGCDPVSLDRIQQAATGLMLELRRRDPHTKSVSTPWGKVSSRETEHWDWSNDSGLLEWLQETHRVDLVDVVTTTKVAKAAIKRAAVIKDGEVVIDGEVIPHVSACPVVTVTVDIDR